MGGHAGLHHEPRRQALAGLGQRGLRVRLTGKGLMLQMPQVGRWTAEYVLLRGLGRLHVFPGDDVGARNNLRRWLSMGESLDYVGVSHVLTRWKAYSGLIYFHLLLGRLAEGGYLWPSPSLNVDNHMTLP
jgi:hypothetical protein